MKLGSCVNNPCQNGGTCNDDSYSPKGYFCSCLTQYYGDNCQDRYNPCANHVCYNGGACLNGACQCVGIYYGTHCERADISGEIF